MLIGPDHPDHPDHPVQQTLRERLGRDMPKQPSRSARWSDAVSKAQEAYDKVKEAADDLQNPLQELEDLRMEYEEWRDNLPENLQQSALGEKLDAVADLDFQSVADDPLDNLGDLEDLIGQAEAAELPLGFGRD